MFIFVALAIVHDSLTFFLTMSLSFSLISSFSRIEGLLSMYFLPSFAVRRSPPCFPLVYFRSFSLSSSLSSSFISLFARDRSSLSLFPVQREAFCFLAPHQPRYPARRSFAPPDIRGGPPNSNPAEIALRTSISFCDGSPP